MGYDLHITRKEFWASKDGPGISSDEWLSVVENDPELTFSEMNRKSSPYLADWSGPGEYPCWIDYSDGELYSKFQVPNR